MEGKYQTVLPNRKKKRLTLCTLAVLACFFSFWFLFGRGRTIRNNGSPDQTGAWKLVWSDEFEGEHLDSSVWTQEVREDGWYNEELQYYTDGEENISFRDGVMVITARYDPNGGKRMYTSARLSSRYKLYVQYGRIEAKMKLPQGQGLWPAFWMLGTANRGQWPGCGEIDIMEAANAMDTCFGTVHWKKEAKKQPSAKKMKGDTYPLSNPEQWHIYALEWTQTEMKWYLDDICYHSFQFDLTDKHQKAFQKPFYLLLNMAVGGNFTMGEVDNSIFPKEYCIDYVRVYTREQGT